MVQVKPREKFIEKGIDALTDRDLIAILVGSGIKELPYNLIANDLYKSVKKALKESGKLLYTDLQGIKGVGEVTAIKLLAGIELGRRLYNLHEAESVSIISTEVAVKRLEGISSKRREYVKALYLNARFGLIREETVAIGSVKRVDITPREIIMPGLECNAAYIILGHNHPSGDPTPSGADVLLTKRIKEACEIVGIGFLDHLIVTTDGRWATVVVKDN